MTGNAISLVSADEQAYLNSIERLIKKRILRREAVGFVAAPFRADEAPERAARPQQNARPARSHSNQPFAPRSQPAPRGFRRIGSASSPAWNDFWSERFRRDGNRFSRPIR